MARLSDLDPEYERKRRRKALEDPRICSVCGKSENEVPFYANRKITQCKEHFNALNKATRRASYASNPQRKKKILEYNNEYLKKHPEKQAPSRAAFAKRQKEKRAAEKEQQLKAREAAGLISLTDVADLLQVTRARAAALKDRGRFGEVVADPHDKRVVLVHKTAVDKFIAERAAKALATNADDGSGDESGG